MPSLKTRKPRIASAAQILRVDDLSMGLELRQSPSLLKPGQARLLRNWTLQEPGALVSYPGWASFSTTSLGARRVQGGIRAYLADEDPFTLASDDGKVYKPTDAGVWGAAVLTGRHATNQHHFCYDRTLAAVFDGANVPKKTTDGSTWTQMGITAPTVAPTTANLAGGSLATLVHTISYSFVDDELAAESNESATVTHSPAGGNLSIRVTVTGPADPQVDTIYVYAQDSTDSVRRKVGSVANPGSGLTTTFDITSKNWTSNQEAPTDHTVPSASLVAAVSWKNRWWAWFNNRLHFTQIFEPQSWPSTFYIELPFEKGDDIAVSVAHGDTLVVFGQASRPYIIIGQTSLDFEVRPALGAQTGALGPRCADVIESGIVHVAAEGVYIFDGASDRLLSYNIDPGWQDLIQRSSTTDLEQIAVVYHGLRKELRVAVPRLYPWGAPGEWVLDLNRTRTQEIPAWTSTDRTIGGYIPWTGHEAVLGDRGRLLSWGLTVAKLYEEAIGNDADGADLVGDYEGATHATGGYVAIFTEGYLEFQPTSGTFAITAIVDGAGLTAQNVTISTGLLPWGDSSAPYGTSSRTYGGRGRMQAPFVLPLAAEGRTLAFRARYTGRTEFKWFTYSTEMVPESSLSGV
jgi:hypothetical protein